MTTEELDRAVESTMGAVLALPGDTRVEKLEALAALTAVARDELTTQVGILEVVRSQIQAFPGPLPLPVGLTMAVSVRARELATQ